ncbi:LolA family protein [Terriglobus sp.]|uniref:LolA family protein n=1 Tax=Terriglobus sp. TaxID=1889013 RepID=UPI003B000AE6
MLKPALATVALVLVSSTSFAATDPALDKVLRQLDAASVKFQSTEADVKDEFYEKVVRDTSTQTGSVYFLRSGDGMEMGLAIGQKRVRFKGGQGMLYDPSAAKKFTPFNTGQNQGKADSFLTLGFGGSGKDLERAWDVKLLGTEQISDGGQTVAVDKLALIPKDPGVKNTFTQVVIWIDPSRSVSLKQEYTTPEGDKRTVTYSHLRYNTKVDTKKYALPKS